MSFAIFGVTNVTVIPLIPALTIFLLSPKKKKPLSFEWLSWEIPLAIPHSISYSGFFYAFTVNTGSILATSPAIPCSSWTFTTWWISL